MTKPGSNPYTRKLKPVMTKYLTGRFGAAEGASRWQRTLQIAQQYWDETAYIGGRENILADNLYMSEVLFAAVEACDRDFPGEDILRLGDELMVDKIRRLSRFVNAPRLVNRRWVQRLVGRMYGSYIKKCWRFTSCPLAEFARAHDMLPWAGYLCQMDHRMAEAAGCRLIRRHTIVAGDDECGYWVVGEDK